LGAAPKAILVLVLRDSATASAPETIVGIFLASLGTHWLKALVYGLAPNDPTTFVAAAGALFTASLIAAFIPAYRAAETDPMTTLRHE
jgi:ABC-type lipoprotein release transport system permease subunit